MNITAPWMIKEECGINIILTQILHRPQSPFFNNKFDSFSTDSSSGELVGGINEKWNKMIENKGQTYVEHPKPKEAGMVKRTYEIKQSSDVARLNNPYLIHPEDYETQQELFDAIKHWNIWDVK